jgi:hypothetical protein
LQLHVHANANDVGLFVMLKNCGLGGAWPSAAIPQAVQIFSMLMPSIAAIDGLVRVAQLGASLSDVRSQFLTLWGLTIFYGCIVVVLEEIRRPRSPAFSARRRAIP